MDNLQANNYINNYGQWGKANVETPNTAMGSSGTQREAIQGMSDTQKLLREGLIREKTWRLFRISKDLYTKWKSIKRSYQK